MSFFCKLKHFNFLWSWCKVYRGATCWQYCKVALQRTLGVHTSLVVVMHLLSCCWKLLGCVATRLVRHGPLFKRVFNSSIPISDESLRDERETNNIHCANKNCSFLLSGQAWSTCKWKTTLPPACKRQGNAKMGKMKTLFCLHHRPTSHRTRDATQRNASTCCHQWECSHCSPSNIKGKHSNLRARRASCVN